MAFVPMIKGFCCSRLLRFSLLFFAEYFIIFLLNTQSWERYSTLKNPTEPYYTTIYIPMMPGYSFHLTVPWLIQLSTSVSLTFSPGWLLINFVSILLTLNSFHFAEVNIPKLTGLSWLNCLVNCLLTVVNAHIVWVCFSSTMSFSDHMKIISRSHTEYLQDQTSYV